MPARLELTLTDAAGADVNDNVTIELVSTETSKRVRADEYVQRTITVKEIPVLATELYRLIVTPGRYRTVQQFARLTDGQSTAVQVALPVDPSKVVSISAPAYQALPALVQGILQVSEVPRFSNGASQFLQGSSLYQALDGLPLLKACLLNIVAKSAATYLHAAQSCLSYFGGLVRLEPDRFFIRTTAALLEDAAQSNTFHAVSPILHDPIPGYRIVSSYKTADHYGNLQLTFQRRGDAGNDYVADVDIDNAQGLEHIFQVVENTFNGPTNPYDIHEILLQQRPVIDPGFGFIFAAKSATGKLGG